MLNTTDTDYRQKRENGLWYYRIPGTDEWKSATGFGWWLKHQCMSMQQYYDMYIEPGIKHVCAHCGKPTRFDCLAHGYYTYCSTDCKCASIEVRTKLSVSSKDRVYNSEVRKHMSDAHRGVTLSIEQCLKISAAHTGMKRSATARAAMSRAQRRFWDNISDEHREYLRQLNSIKITQAYANGKMRNCGRGKRTQFDDLQYCTNKSSILTRSSYESVFVQLLEQHAIAYAYEPFHIQYAWQNVYEHRYTPDFYLPALNLLIEIKNSYSASLERNICKFNAAMQYCKLHNMRFVVLTEHELFDGGLFDNLHNDVYISKIQKQYVCNA